MIDPATSRWLDSLHLPSSILLWPRVPVNTAFHCVKQNRIRILFLQYSHEPSGHSKLKLLRRWSNYYSLWYPHPSKQLHTCSPSWSAFHLYHSMKLKHKTLGKFFFFLCFLHLHLTCERVTFLVTMLQCLQLSVHPHPLILLRMGKCFSSRDFTLFYFSLPPVLYLFMFFFAFFFAFTHHTVY